MFDLTMKLGPLLAATMLLPMSAQAADLYVDATADPGGDGSAAMPFVEIQEALDVAVMSDVIHVLPGTYAPIATVTDGMGVAPITVVAEPVNEAIVQADGTALEAHHAYHTFQGLIFDGGYGADNTIDADGADFLELINAEVRHSGESCINLHTVEGVLIANSNIHHCIADTKGVLEEAHGVTGDSVFDLDIRDTEISMFTGDAVQMSATGDPWSGLVLTRCTLFAGALDEAVGMVVAGTLIGNNALDTQVGPELDGSGAFPQVMVVDTVAYGFRDVIADQAAYDVRDEVDMLIDRVTVYDSQIAFRLRGPAQVQVRSAVVYDVDSAIRYEEGLADASLLASTFGRGVLEAFTDGGGAAPTNFTVENLLVFGDAVPGFAAGGAANMAVDVDVFVDADAHDYHLLEMASPVDMGVDLPEIMLDRDGVARPVGPAFDIGAYEWFDDSPPPPPGDSSGNGGDTADGGTSGSSSGGVDDDTGGTSEGASTGATSIGTGAPPPGPGAPFVGGTDVGCECRTSGRTNRSWLLWLLLGLVVRRRGRRPTDAL